MVARTRFVRGAVLAAVGGGLALLPGTAWAQGCICARQTQPVFSPDQSPYLKKGQWQLSSSYRFNRSDTLYSGSKKAPGAPEVIRKQHIFDVAGTYAITEQTNLTLTVPFADNSFGLGVPPPRDPDVARTSGIGDVQLVARHWLLKCPDHPNENISLGLGVKFPTGNYDARDSFRNGAGVRDVRFVDISTQPGDGGVGLILDLQAFKRFKNVTAFFSGTYLANPRETNGTPSLPFALMGAGAPPNARVNSVPDQYVARLGAAVPIKGVKGLSLSLAGRLEGVPPSDLIGGDKGFRFAGYAVFIEPGLTYTTGRDSFSVNVPVTIHRRIQNIDSTPGPDMGTIVPYSVIFTYSHRFGK